MTPRLTPTDWRTLAKALEKAGCTLVRERGSHLIYDHPKIRRPVVIPTYDEVPVTVVGSNLRTLGLSRAAYLKLLKDP